MPSPSISRSAYVAVTTTVDHPARARALARRIVASRLAACAQHWPIQSVYWWRGRMESARESIVLAKTRAALAPQLVQFIKDRHAYEVPEIVVTPLKDGWKPYLDWIGQETKRKPGRKTGR